VIRRIARIASLLSLLAGGVPADRAEVVIGKSVKGRPITAHRVGDSNAPRKAVIVGNIHGDEPQGLRVVRAIRARASAVHGIDLWLIDTVNPDGLRAHGRQNAHGVDLNRNFGVRWRRTGPPGSRYFAGRHAFSEPESRAVRELLLRLRPAITIWYHQPFGFVYPPLGGGDPAVTRAYAALTGNDVRTPPRVRYTGTATMWQNARLPESTAFVVELPASALSSRGIVRHARAAMKIAALGAGG
jgi:murein peptide amidase A